MGRKPRKKESHAGRFSIQHTSQVAIICAHEGEEEEHENFFPSGRRFFVMKRESPFAENDGTENCLAHASTCACNVGLTYVISSFRS
jgi:hypothetical protein